MAIFTTQGKEWNIDKNQSVEPKPAGGNGGAAGPGLTDRIGWGTGNAAEAVGNTFATVGVTEAAEGRVTATLSQPTATTDRAVGTMTATGAKSVTQAWRTNTTTKGEVGQIMFIYILFTAVPVEVGDAITFTIDYVQS